jgi:hypothetical protein
MLPDDAISAGSRYGGNEQCSRGATVSEKHRVVSSVTMDLVFEVIAASSRSIFAARTE